MTIIVENGSALCMDLYNAVLFSPTLVFPNSKHFCLVNLSVLVKTV